MSYSPERFRIPWIVNHAEQGNTNPDDIRRGAEPLLPFRYLSGGVASRTIAPLFSLDINRLNLVTESNPAVLSEA